MIAAVITLLLMPHSYKLRTLFLVVTIVAVALCAWLLFTNDIRNSAFLTAPVQTKIKTQPNGNLISNIAYFARGNFAAVELGNIRIAVKGETFDGENIVHDVLLSGHDKLKGENGSSRIDGNRTVFSENVTPEGTILEFVGLSFEVVEGRLNLMGRSLPVDGPHTLVMVQDGQISAITPLQQ